MKLEPLNHSTGLIGRLGQERIEFPQLLVNLSSELWRKVHGRAVLRGLAEHCPFPFQCFQGSLEGRELIGRESVEEVIFEHVVLPEHSVAVELVENCGFVSGNGPQAGGNRTRKYK